MRARNESHIRGRGARLSTPEPTEEELRELDEQLRKLRVEDVVLQSTVSLVNLAGRRLGLSPGGESDRDLGQVRDGIDAVRALLPVLERVAPAEALRAIRDALSQLQMEYARLAQAGTGTGAGPASGREPPAEETAPGTGAEQSEQQQRRPGPAESSGRLWVPGR